MHARKFHHDKIYQLLQIAHLTNMLFEEVIFQIAQVLPLLSGKLLKVNV